MAEVLAEAPPAVAPRRREPPVEEGVAPVVSGRRLSQWASALAVVLVVALVAVASDIAGLVVIGAVLAYLLVPLVDRMERRGMDRTLATALVLVVLFAATALALTLALPAALDQVASLQARWQSGELLDLVRGIEANLARTLGLASPDELGLVESIRHTLEPEDGALISYVPGVLSTLGNAIVVPFVMFALMKDGPTLRRRMLSFVPNRYFEFAMTVFYKADAHLGGYLRGQALIALLVGVTTALALGLVGVDYYLILGLITGVANFVPYVGFVVSGALTAMVSIVTTGSMDQIVPIVIVFGIVQGIENVVFQPLITGRTVSMHPVLVLLAILVGGRVAGVLGMALGVPVAAVLKVLFMETAVGLRRYHL